VIDDRIAGGRVAAFVLRRPARAGLFSWACALLLAVAPWVQATTPPASPAQQVRGTVVLPAEADRPADGQLVVELRETGSDRVWAEQRLPLDRSATEQPFVLVWRREPLPFKPELHVRAALLAQGRVLWLSEPLKLGPPARTMEVGPLTLLRAPPPLAFQRRIDCGARQFVVGLDGDRLVLRDGDQSIPLRHDAQPPGARHVAIDDPATYVQTEGTTAEVAVRGVLYAACNLLR
jgi:hypothetical protein